MFGLIIISDYFILEAIFKKLGLKPCADFRSVASRSVNVSEPPLKLYKYVQAVLVTAKDYLVSDPSERNIDIPIIIVKQAFEPPHFTGYFGAWDYELWPVLYIFFLGFAVFD